MVKKREMVSVLTGFGLTKLEAELYLTLLIKGETEAKEIVRALNIHFPQFYSIINNLARKGFIETQESRPKKYRAVDLKEIIEREQQKMNQNAEFLLKSIKKFQSTRSTKQRPSIWITKGFQNILHNLNAIIKEAQFDVTVILHNKFISRIIKSLIKKQKEGVQTYLVIYPTPPEPNLMRQVNEIRRVRLFETYPFGISVVADSEKALLAHGLPEKPLFEGPYGVVFIESLLPTFLSENFYTLWDHAKPLVPQEKSAQFPKIFRSHRLALIEIKDLLNKGEVTVQVKGRYIQTGEPFEETGTIVNVTETELLKNFTLRLRSGNMIEIGGPYATLEEVEAELITILKLTPEK